MSHQTKLVALGVGEYHPPEFVAKLVASYLGGSCRRQPRYVSFYIGSAEIEVQTVFSGGGIRHPLEAELGPFGSVYHDEFAGEQVVRRTAELFCPPAGQRCRVAAVEGHHLYTQCHTARPYAVGDKNPCNAAE